MQYPEILFIFHLLDYREYHLTWAYLLYLQAYPYNPLNPLLDHIENIIKLRGSFST